MKNTEEFVSPLGGSAEESASRRYARSERYREQHDRLAPWRAIAEAVVLTRGERGLTQRELGRAIGTTDTAISRIESGRHAVTLETLAKLGKALDLTFMVGSEEAARTAGANDRCVIVPGTAGTNDRDVTVPGTAIEQPTAPDSVRRAPTQAPVSAPVSMPTHAFGDTAGARPGAARRAR